jgi:hypothetical protein
MASSWLSAVVYVLTCGLVQWGDQEEERDAAAPLLAAPSPSRWARCVPLAELHRMLRKAAVGPSCCVPRPFIPDMVQAAAQR